MSDFLISATDIFKPQMTSVKAEVL